MKTIIIIAVILPVTLAQALNTPAYAGCGKDINVCLDQFTGFNNPAFPIENDTEKIEASYIRTLIECNKVPTWIGVLYCRSDAATTRERDLANVK